MTTEARIFTSPAGAILLGKSVVMGNGSGSENLKERIYETFHGNIEMA